MKSDSSRCQISIAKPNTVWVRNSIDLDQSNLNLYAIRSRGAVSKTLNSQSYDSYGARISNFIAQVLCKIETGLNQKFIS